ncbi:MAG: aminotransferase DegT, partial [Actinobacteria bacterium]|nr:aminotransferase DegT [Actinomycetota bacterium]
AEEIGKRGIGSGVYYPIPNHRLPSYGLTMDMPETELAAKQALSLPVHPSLSQGDLEKIVEVVNAVASAGA